MAQELTIKKPCDMHLHLRDDAVLNTVATLSAAWAGRAIIMPNLQPPITTADMAVAYRERILAALPEGTNFDPLMTLYLTDTTSPADIAAAKATGVVKACKLYPAGATTNSESGVTDLMKLVPTFQAMEEHGIVLCIHGEVVDPEVDFFEREQVFIADKLEPMLAQVPNLKVVIEHATTKEAVAFVEASQHPAGIGCTITPQHMLYNRNALFNKGLNPHFFCLPILKREEDRLELLRAATSGNPRFFAGTDSAPHRESNKLTCCGHAGCFSANAAAELYTEAFDGAGALDKLEGFLSTNGAEFYGLEPTTETITFVKIPQTIPETIPLVTAPSADECGPAERLVPLRAGLEVAWSVKKQ